MKTLKNPEKSVRVVSRKEILETQKSKRKPRANNNRELHHRPFEQALRYVTIKEAK